MEIALLLFFLLVTLSHGFTLLFAKRRQRSPYRYRRLLWRLHFLINGLLWTLLVLWIGLIQFSQGSANFPLWTKEIGIVLIISGVFLSSISFHTLGLNQAMGYRFFFPDRVRRTQKGVYKYLRNPIYDSFVLIFIGLGMVLRTRLDFYLAFESFILLNILLAALENYEHPESLRDFF